MARIGEMLGWGENPWYQLFNDNRGAVSGAARGAMANPGNAWAGASYGLEEGGQADERRGMIEQQEAERQEQINQTAQWLQQNYPAYSNLPVEKGWELAMKDEAAKRAGSDTTANQNDYLFAKSNGFEGTFEDWMRGGTAGATEYGLTPIWGQMPDGTFAYGVQGKDGSFQPVDTGEMTPLDPRSLAGERAYGANLGGAQGDAAAAAPQDISTGMIALDLVNQIKTSPELGWATGTSAGLGGNAIPGTGRFGFQTLVDQAKSGAFLTAIQEMRGLGALSNSEGQTATQAITRMNTALSTEDFVAALEDYERIVQMGVQRAQSRIGSGPNVGGGATPSAAGYTVLGVE